MTAQVLIDLHMDPPREGAPGVHCRSDEDLMRDYQSGDGEAFRALYFRHRGRLYRFVLRLMRNPALAEDVFQETWIAVVNGRTRYTADARFVTYLFGIAHRRMADHWRKSQRQPLTDTPDGDAEDLAATTMAVPSTSTPHGWAENADLGTALLAALDRLPLPQREAFLMKAEGDLSLDDIARITGASRETIKSRLRYATERLRHALRSWK